MKYRASGLFAALAALLSFGVAAQTYPAKPVKLIVPFAAGGAVDILGRVMAQELASATGGAFVVENKPGAGGLLALNEVAKSAPDGYTLAVGSPGPLTIGPNLFVDAKFEPLERLEPIIWFAGTPAVLVVRNDLPAKNVAELVALSKATPAGLNMASTGSGSLAHLMAKYFESMAAVAWAHVPYKSSAPALGDMAAGRIDVMIDSLPTAAPFVRSGKLRALAVTTAKRAADLPEVPTLQELGYAEYDVSSWYALLAPKGTPPAVIRRLNAELNKALQSPEVRDRIRKIGAEAEGGGPERLSQRIRQEYDRWARVIKAANIKVE
jgi:tripartite-type tricarboxylate transporter receptor subunit TctC